MSFICATKQRFFYCLDPCIVHFEKCFVKFLESLMNVDFRRCRRWWWRNLNLKFTKLFSRIWDNWEHQKKKSIETSRLYFLLLFSRIIIIVQNRQQSYFLIIFLLPSHFQLLTLNKRLIFPYFFNEVLVFSRFSLLTLISQQIFFSFFIHLVQYLIFFICFRPFKTFKFSFFFYFF